jgi:carbon-monoxide dehydrogenase large subunit
MRFGIGPPVTRKEDRRFLTGQGQYVADIELARQTYAVFVYSPHAHARIRSIDTEAAARTPGVFAVLTAEEWAADGLGTLVPGFMAEDVGGPPADRVKTRFAAIIAISTDDEARG